MNRKESPIVHIVLILYSIICLIPFVLIISASFTDEIALNANGFTLIPSEFSTLAYEYVFRSPIALVRAYGVSVFITVATVIFGLLCMGMIGYVLSRPNCVFRKPLAFIVFFTMLFSGGMVPSYIIMTQTLHLRNTLASMILPWCMNAFYVIMMRTFFQQLPSPLFEAAKIDGASELKIFFSIAVPISKPVFVTVGFFLALGKWNDWYSPLLYITEEKLYPLQYLLYKIQLNIKGLLQAMEHGYVVNATSIPGDNLMMAMAVLAAGPMLFVFPFFHKYYASGLTLGAIKE